MTDLPPAAQAAELATDAVAALGSLRRAWSWLALARLPGVPGTAALVERRMSEAAARAESAAARRDRHAAHAALRAGLTPPGPHAAPARLGPVRTRLYAAARVRAVAGRLGVHEGLVLPGPLSDPAISRDLDPCPWCAGTGLTLRPAGWNWPWPDPAPPCGLCGGRGAYHRLCGATADGCGCDLADVVVAACLDAISGALAGVDNPAVAGWCASQLRAADTAARRALGLADIDLRIIKAPCPACGRRDLHADVSSPKRFEWSILCRSPLCRCAGAGCGCGRPVRWAGRVHRWPAGEFQALAARLGTSLPIDGWDGR